jgi:hypothetical protein
MFNKLASEASLLNKSYCLAAALSVKNFITVLAMYLVTLCCAALVRLIFNKATSEAGLLNKGLCLART